MNQRPMGNKLAKALNDPLYVQHSIGKAYVMDGKPELWKAIGFDVSGDQAALDQVEALLKK